jgi:hypothetical protein
MSFERRMPVKDGKEAINFCCGLMEGMDTLGNDALMGAKVKTDILNFFIDYENVCY